MRTDFYVYVYLDPRKPGDYNYGEYHFDYEPFYVGKGSGTRMFSHLCNSIKKKNGNKLLINKINKIQRNFDIKQYIIKYKEALEESIAYKLEETMEQIIGRKDLKLGPLCNLKKAGLGGPSNRIVSDETREKMRISLQGRIVSDETREKIRMALIGNTNSTGNKLSEDHIRKIVESNTGRVPSEKTRCLWRKQRKGSIPWNKGKTGIYTQETLDKISKGAQNRVYSQEYRNKMSILAKNQWLRQKAKSVETQ